MCLNPEVKSGCDDEYIFLVKEKKSLLSITGHKNMFFLVCRTVKTKTVKLNVYFHATTITKKVLYILLCM